MKNIHVLPTEKPSRIYLIKSNNKLGITSNNPEFTENFGCGTQNQNINITSNEEIKDGDWFMSDFNSFPIHNIKELSEREGTLGWEQKDLKNNLKIILTTDQDLIKDGVQSIDDDFLEWFVKNPSCESVEVVLDDLCFISSNYEKNYKIIIPKEETIDEGEGEAYRQELFNYLYDNFGAIASELEMRDIEIIVLSTEALKDKQEPKQETLEKAAREYYKRGQLGFEKAADTERAFLRGGLWQQEQDKNKFSEEDMKQFALKCVITYTFNKNFISDNFRIPIERNNNNQFEQFKNK
jgi:hypothetical protein